MTSLNERLDRVQKSFTDNMVKGMSALKDNTIQRLQYQDTIQAFELTRQSMESGEFVPTTFKDMMNKFEEHRASYSSIR